LGFFESVASHTLVHGAAVSAVWFAVFVLSSSRQVSTRRRHTDVLRVCDFLNQLPVTHWYMERLSRSSTSLTFYWPVWDFLNQLPVTRWCVARLSGWLFSFCPVRICHDQHGVQHSCLIGFLQASMQDGSLRLWSPMAAFTTWMDRRHWIALNCDNDEPAKPFNRILIIGPLKFNNPFVSPLQVPTIRATCCLHSSKLMFGIYVRS
jgi:hypothetical protein